MVILLTKQIFYTKSRERETSTETNTGGVYTQHIIITDKKVNKFNLDESSTIS